MSLEMVNKRLKIIEDLQEEINRIKALYSETLENSEEMQKIEEESKKFREETKERKQKVMQKPELVSFQEQMKDISSEIKANKEVLAQELADYYKESGSMEFTDSDGNTKRVIFSVKLIDVE